LQTTATAVDHADRIGASTTVMGSRRLTPVKSLLLGSVYREVIQHAEAR
jgi:nucleotide-binding universal stress UspA family protein